MSNGQADEAPDAADDLIQFLADNPEADAPVAGEEEEDESDDPSQEDKSEEEEESPDDEVKTSEAAKDQTSDLKFKVPVKGEDGSETTVEVDQKELIAGYQRHSDYTRKTMELANKEREVTDLVSTKLAQGQQHFIEQAQFAQAAIRETARMFTPDEMSRLAATDQAAWVQAHAHNTQIETVLSKLDGAIQQQKAQALRQQEAHVAAMEKAAWDELSKEGFDRPKLAKLRDTLIQKFGETPERLAGVRDARLIRIFAAAAAYEDLKDKKATVAKKVAEAPKLPAQRQSVPKSEQIQRDLSGRFRGGRAKLNDLAAYIANS